MNEQPNSKAPGIPAGEPDRGTITQPRPRVAVVGRGRVGPALAEALRAAGYVIDGPLARGADARGADVVLLCVPDREVANAASAIVPGPLVGHCSGALTLAPLRPHAAFSLHPLMTVTDAGAPFEGAGCAIAADGADALATAHALAVDLGMTPFEIADEDRAAYHAAASMASNFVIALAGAAERLGRSAGLADRAALAALARASVENWTALGPERALTGPIVRGDEETVARQREAVAERAPELVALFDALADATRALASEGALA
jgi:predicted short-subunit dehydrogenase-like oxidoreductase (DUF2520 family)